MRPARTGAIGILLGALASGCGVGGLPLHPDGGRFCPDGGDGGACLAPGSGGGGGQCSNGLHVMSNAKPYYGTYSSALVAMHVGTYGAGGGASDSCFFGTSPATPAPNPLLFIHADGTYGDSAHALAIETDVDAVSVILYLTTSCPASTGGQCYSGLSISGSAPPTVLGFGGAGPNLLQFTHDPATQQYKSGMLVASNQEDACVSSDGAGGPTLDLAKVLALARGWVTSLSVALTCHVFTGTGTSIKEQVTTDVQLDQSALTVAGGAYPWAAPTQSFGLSTLGPAFQIFSDFMTLTTDQGALVDVRYAPPGGPTIICSPCG